MERINTKLIPNPAVAIVTAATLLERIGRAQAELSEIQSALQAMTETAPAERDLVLLQGVRTGAGAKASAQVETVSADSAASTAQQSNGWKPGSRTMQVIKLMQQGLSNDAIAVRKDIQVEPNAANLRKIRQRARAHGLLRVHETDKRDTP